MCTGKCRLGTEHDVVLGLVIGHADQHDIHCNTFLSSEMLSYAPPRHPPENLLSYKGEVRGRVWSLSSLPRPPATNVDPPGAHPTARSILGGSREVSVHQMPCHFPSLPIHRLAPVGHAAGKERAYEAVLLRGARLWLWSGHADLAHGHWADAGGLSRVPGHLPKSGG